MDDILDILQAAGRKKGDDLLASYKSLGPAADWEADDEALRYPFQLVGQTADKCHQGGFTKYRKELDTIVALVEEAYGVYVASWRKYKKEQAPPVKEKKSKSQQVPQRKEGRCDVGMCQQFCGASPWAGADSECGEIRASYAYTRKPKFAFHVAFRELCILKAKSMPGGSVPALLKFDEAKKINGSYLRASKRNPLMQGGESEQVIIEQCPTVLPFII